MFTSLLANPEARSNFLVAGGAGLAILVHGVLRWTDIPGSHWPLVACLLLGGGVLLLHLCRNLFAGEFGTDFLAGVSILTSICLQEYLAGCLIVLMLSGGQLLEAYAVRNASRVLEALAKRMPATAQRKTATGTEEIPVDQIEIGDVLILSPHAFCPVDAVVLEGHGSMDESYLTGEPYNVAKSPGSSTLSGAINGASLLMLKATKRAVDSRYAQVMEVMRQAEQSRPRIRRLADQLGGAFTPVALVVALAAWFASGEPTRFLAVVVVATPCPLLIAIPTAIIGAISLAASRGIILRNPSVLERLGGCRTAIFDKTGTLTYGKPIVTAILPTSDIPANEVLGLVASLEQYSRHPLSQAVLDHARREGVKLSVAEQLREDPGAGLTGAIAGRAIEITSRAKLAKRIPEQMAGAPETQGGLECVVAIDGRLAAVIQFRDAPRTDGRPFLSHLAPRHKINRVLLVTGDRLSEAKYLAEAVGIREIFADQSPEQKLALVRAETERAPTLYLGDGINDAPALAVASVGVAFGSWSDVTSEAADVVVLERSLKKVDELLHVAQRFESIAYQSALGGIGLSLVAMLFAATGGLSPVLGAVCQEAIDVVTVLNAVRAARTPRSLSDF